MPQRTYKPRRVVTAAGLTTFGLAVMMLAACGEEDRTHTYQSPKDAAVPVAPTGVGSFPVTADASSGTQAFEWDLPEGWEQASGGGPMRFATLTGGESASNIKVTVVRLPLRSGSLLANVNRWRGQMGLADVQEAGLSDLLHPLESGAIPGTLVDLLGPVPEDDERKQERMVAVIFKGPDATWFFKARGELEVIASAEAEILALFRSVRSPAASHVHMESAQVATGDGPPAIGPLRYEVPDGWELDPHPRTARLATLVFGSGQLSGELAITRFPGDVGGELANVNRWRGQLGLPPVADLLQQKVTNLEIGGLAARSYRFAADGDDPMRSAINVASVMRNGQSWFFKMTGPDQLLTAEVEDFERFVASIRFDGD